MMKNLLHEIADDVRWYWSTFEPRWLLVALPLVFILFFIFYIVSLLNY